jgi:hypothetical protein
MSDNPFDPKHETKPDTRYASRRPKQRSARVRLSEFVHGPNANAGDGFGTPLTPQQLAAAKRRTTVI